MAKAVLSSITFRQIDVTLAEAAAIFELGGSPDGDADVRRFVQSGRPEGIRVLDGYHVRRANLHWWLAPNLQLNAEQSTAKIPCPNGHDIYGRPITVEIDVRIRLRTTLVLEVAGVGVDGQPQFRAAKASKTAESEAPKTAESGEAGAGCAAGAGAEKRAKSGRNELVTPAMEAEVDRLRRKAEKAKESFVELEACRQVVKESLTDEDTKNLSAELVNALIERRAITLARKIRNRRNERRAGKLIHR